jgi:hypothetical protein
MQFTIYERALSFADFKNVDINEMCRELSLPIPDSAIMKRNTNTYLLKIGLVKDKQNALDNLMKTIDGFTNSNNDIIIEASNVSATALNMRLNLETSVLESQLKMLEMESISIDAMTAGDFINKYGA